MSDIFISYSSADKEKAEQLANSFAQKGWSVWWDRQIPPGKSFDDVIENALNAARCVIVLWSKDSVSSRWVKTEAAEAAVKGVLVPVMIDNAAIPLEFKRIEAADLSDWTGNEVHFEFTHLLKTIESLLSENAPQTQAKQNPAKPIIPNQPGNPSSVKRYLLFTVVVITFLSLWFYWSTTQIDLKIKTQPYFAKPVLNEVESATERPEIRNTQSQTASPQPEGLKSQTPAINLSSKHKKINLLAAENGGQLLVASSDDWTATIDGKEEWGQISYGLGKEAVYGFKDEKPALFDTFSMLITETADTNVKSFELSVGNDSPTGAFESIGKFQTQNVKLFKTPYQVFNFPGVTAKYFKVKLLETYGASHPIVHEFQLFGTME
ncbi:MAG: TIR domain-containing protein [Methylococcaceae bacterium]|nr:TIR domain-containing protein [Methylococcaceae bacterium]